MKVAVTGASGHIGNCLVRELLNQGAEIRALLHHTDDSIRNLNLELVQGDLLDIDSIRNLCENADVVYHLAARIAIDKSEERLVYQTNVEGTQNLVDICFEKRIRKIIHFSSIHALDAHPLDQILDETRPLIGHPVMVYERSKAEGERIVMKAAGAGLEAVILNPTAVIGPFDYNHSYLGQALIKIYENKLPMLVPGGYDWVDVRDVVETAIHAATKGRSGERYILSGHWHSLRELAEMTEQISGRKTSKTMMPIFFARLGTPFIKFYSVLKNEHPLYTSESLDILKNSNCHISSEKAKKEFGYHPRPIIETLKNTFQWYRETGIIK